MSAVPPSIRGLAGQLIAIEAGSNKPPAAEEVVRVVEKLRVPLIKFAGVVGFRSLLSRALALANAEVPSLKVLHVLSDGKLERVGELAQSQDAEALENGATVLVAHLLGLLVTFIGQPITLRLVQDAWPDASIDAMDLRTEEPT
jgi:hypothetical protein